MKISNKYIAVVVFIIGISILIFTFVNRTWAGCSPPLGCVSYTMPPYTLFVNGYYYSLVGLTLGIILIIASLITFYVKKIMQTYKYM